LATLGDSAIVELTQQPASRRLMDVIAVPIDENRTAGS
jgi:hypothetical protein